MNLSIFVLLFLVYYCEYANAVSDVKCDFITDDEDAGEPLLLTKYIREKKQPEGRLKSLVHHPAIPIATSYSGFITTEEKYNSNTFFWFFPAQNNPETAPVILWLIGGPALSGLIAIFRQNGPLLFKNRKVMAKRQYSIGVNHSVIYVDNPIGTGFSFTDSDAGYARKLSDTAQHMIEFLNQFFEIYPEYRKNDFFIGGDSYGGKFVTATSTIVENYNKVMNPLNFKGMIMGNAIIDTDVQGNNGEYLFQNGLVDKKGRETLKKYDFQRNKNGMLDRIATVQKLAGFSYQQNLLQERAPYTMSGQDDVSLCVANPSFRKALHVGNKQFNLTSDYARDFYEDPTRNPVTTLFQKLLDKNKKVLLYHGQLDITFPYQQSEELYESLKWSGAEDYKKTERMQWWLNDRLAGYTKTVRNFNYALIRNAGHVTFLDQPEWTSVLITRFTRGQPFSDPIRKTARTLESRPTRHFYFY